jgi:hypothetical protein
MKIVIINGSAETGKDKFVKIFKDKFENLRVKNISSVDKVKSVAEIAFGWNGKKDDKSRKMLSDMKRVWSEFNDGPTKYVFEKIDIDTKYCIEKNKKLENNIYFLHIREPEEIDKVKNKYEKNCITLLIRKNTEYIPSNYSDKNVENYKYDYIIENNGDIKELEKNVVKFKKFLIK